MTRRKHILVSRDQERLPFSARGTGGILAHGTTGERLLLALSVTIFALSAILYMYSVMASVAHVASRGKLEQQGALLSADVAKLEARYLTSSQGITEAYARDHGFISITKSVYVERASLVTLNDSR
ncbi:MAG: hypothetical protein AAB923_00025 [Patescibacteria group bacterium]